MKNETREKYLRITILWLFIAFLSSQSFLLFVGILTVPFVLIYLLVCFYNFIRRKKSIKEIMIKLLIILTAYLIIGTFHYIRHEIARNYGNKVVAEIYEFKNKNGFFPLNSYEFGLDQKAMSEGGVSYNYIHEEPIIFYPSTEIMFDTYMYSFQEKTWEYRPD